MLLFHTEEGFIVYTNNCRAKEFRVAGNAIIYGTLVGQFGQRNYNNAQSTPTT
jgi:hypothetical protein